jgi:serine/threonine protein kinase
MPIYEVGSRVTLSTRPHLTRIQGLEDYKLIEKMGDGAFSNVYKAVERKTGRKVAVKVVRKYELNSSQVRPLFNRSVRSVSSLS